MDIIKKIEPNDKVRKRIAACREASMTVKQDFIGGVAEVKSGDELVMRCVRNADQTWEVEYNVKFWDEQER